MAKEDDLKRVDLKVTVNCCEGCKRKVVKALSIKGVLKTEIHPTLPKITVIGTVDTKILIKKLARIGKTAEIFPDETQKPKKDEKDSDDKAEKDGDKRKDKEGKCPGKMDVADDSKSNGKKYDMKKAEKGEKETKEAKVCCDSEESKIIYPTIAAAIPQVSYGVNPISVVQRSVDNNPMGINQQQVYYQMEPVMVPLPYYAAMNAYSAPMQYAYQYNGGYREPPVYRPPPPPPLLMQSPGSGFADFFNEDNTVGCYVM